MFKKNHTKTLSAFLFAGLLGGSGWAERVFYPDSVSELIRDIIIANSDRENDVIDLRGKTFYLEVINNTSVNGPNALPVIGPDMAVVTPHSLTVANGTLEIALFSGQQARHFEVAASANLHLDNVRLLYGNSGAYDGGSIFNSGTFSAEHVAFVGNQSLGNGGAIYNFTSGVLNIGSSTFNLNYSGGNPFDDTKVNMFIPPEGGGGAIANDGSINRLFNSTFASNSTAGSGGALFNAVGTINFMTNNTIALNSAVELGGGIYISGLGYTMTAGGIQSFISNIVAANSAAGSVYSNDIDDPTPLINNPQYNLIGVAGVVGGEGNAITAAGNNQVGSSTAPLDPGLRQLQYNGGEVWTMALNSDSLAINAGYNPVPLRFDERGHGYARTSGGATDIGAYELQFCEFDTDHDGVCNDLDNCPCTYNPDQRDCNHNGIGDACDLCPCPHHEEPCDDSCGPCPPHPEPGPCPHPEPWPHPEPGPCPPHHDDDDHHETEVE